MKATGIVRRIDDLGRVVVPKEVRRTLRIREGDPLEIFTDHEGEIILKKYSPIGELGQFAAQYAECMAQVLGCLVCVTDCDRVIAAAGAGRKNYYGKPLTEELEQLIADRAQQTAVKEGQEMLKFTLDDMRDYQAQVIRVIVSEGDAIGAIVICGQREQLQDPVGSMQMAKIAAEFLGRQMEN